MLCAKSIRKDDSKPGTPLRNWTNCLTFFLPSTSAWVRPPARVAGADWRVCYVGHASFLIQTAGLNMLLDPVWSKRASPFRFVGPRRVNDPGIAFADLPPIDVVLVSHGHYDHLDLTTLSRLAAAHRPRIITPLGNDTIMRNHDPAIAAEAHDWHDRINVGGGVAR